MYIYENMGDGIPLPGQYPPHCAFMPIAPRHLAVHGKAGSETGARASIGGLLEGHPSSASPGRPGFAAQMMAEIQLFRGLDLPKMTLYFGGERAVKTGQKQVYCAA